LLQRRTKARFYNGFKSNRIVALSEEDKENKKYISIKNTTAGTADRGDLARRTRFSAVAYKANFQKREWYNRRVVLGL
jgi:hypothetical protein